MFAPTPSPQGSGNQSNQERKKERCPHGYRGPVVGEKINTVHKIWEKCSKQFELMKLCQELLNVEYCMQ